MTAQHHVEHCMGTVFSFDIRGNGVPAAALAETVALLHEIDRLYSTYRPDSVISRLDRGELDLADAGTEVRQVLDECDRWQRLTSGWFSPRATGALDPSGYVKGWAVQRASDLLAAAGSTSHCVNGGGDVQCLGSADGRPWQVGIADPFDPARVLSVVSGAGLAVATSGTAERGRHIVDPHTGLAAGGLVSLTVVGTRIVDCDVLATAGVAMGRAAHAFFAGRTDVRALGITDDGGTWSTFDTALPAGTASGLGA